MTKSLYRFGAVALALAVAGAVTAAQVTNGAAQTPPAQNQNQVQPVGPQGRGRMGAAPVQRPAGPGQMGPDQLGPAPAPGQRGRGRGGPGGAGSSGPFREGMLGNRLDLTAEQRASIDALQRTARDQAAAAQDELDLTRRTLHREIFADKRDNARIASLATKAAALEKQLADLRLKTETAIADLLTPAQRETMRLAGGRGPADMGRFGGPGAGRGRMMSRRSRGQ